MNKRIINIPYALLKKCVKDKRLRQLLALSVCLKMNFGHSGCHPTISLLRNILKCGAAKAERLLNQAKNCPELFYYNEGRNFLSARNFKIGYLHKDWVNLSRKKRKLAISAYCYKFEYNSQDILSHQNVTNDLFDVRVLGMIADFERENNFIEVGGDEPISTSCSDRANALSLRKLAAILGCHFSTVGRHLNKLEARGVITTTRFKLIPVMFMPTHTWLVSDTEFQKRQLIVIGRYGYVREANEYRLGENFDKKLCNVIFNHEQRLRRNFSASESWYQCFI